MNWRWVRGFFYAWWVYSKIDFGESVNILKATEQYALNELAVWEVNYISIQWL